MKRLLMLLALLPALTYAEVYHVIDHGSTSQFIPCFPLYDVTDGATTLTGMDSGDAGFKVLLMADNESAATEFAGAADLETIATIGTWVTPTDATDIRFGECDSTDFDGFYQIQFHNDHLVKSNAQYLTLKITDGGTLIGDQIIFIDQNAITTADINAETGSAIEATLLLATGVCDSGSTTTCVDAVRTEADDDYWLDADFCSTSGTTIGQCKRISAFTQSTDTITFDAMTAAIGTNTYEIRAGSSSRDIITGTNGVLIADDALTAAKIAANAIGPSEMANDAIDALAIADDAIDAATFAAGAVDANALAADAIDEIWDEVVEDQGATYTGRCLLAILGAYAAGEFATVGNTTTYQDTSGTETRIVGTVTASGRDTMSITCP